jgi:serine phosphatase RsbU (regulator of sigma subunit)
MFQKLRNQLLIAFLLLSALSVLQAILNIQLNNQRSGIEQISQILNDIELNVMNQNKAVNDFFTYEPVRPNYFINHQSAYLTEQDNYNEQLNHLCQSLKGNNLFYSLDHNNSLIKIVQISDSLNKCVDSISQLVFIRGFKDYGLEGEMRDYAHALEAEKILPLEVLLMLRRHEKDYIIRNEKKYIDLFNALANNWISIFSKKCINDKKICNALEELTAYQLKFNQMASVDSKTGIKNNSALRNQIGYFMKLMMVETHQINLQCDIFKKRIYAKLQVISTLIAVLILLSSFFLSLFLSKIATRRITNLSQTISNYIGSCFTDTEPVPVRKLDDEIGRLIENFELMRQKINDQINYLEVKVAERTEEISIQKEMLQKQNTKLMDSVRYALNIQEALLPNSDLMAQSFTEHFILYMPKDMVSGDFYWYKRLENEEFDVSILAVADCTGHGVPGGFMSMLGFAFLNDIYISKKVNTPAEILNRLRKKMLDALASKEKSRRLNDGMDIGMVMIDHLKNKLMFSGAYRPLYFIRNNTLQKIKGDSMPIGRHLNEVTSFSLHEIEMQPGDLFYLCSDGFADQHNHETGKKFLSRRLQNLLLENSQKPMGQQKTLLYKELKAWKNGAEQTDDILIIGIKN